MMSAVTTAAVDYLAMVYGMSFGKSSSVHKERNATTIRGSIVKLIPALNFYFMIVVYSFFCELKEGSQVLEMDQKA